MYDHSPPPGAFPLPRRLNHWRGVPPEVAQPFAVHTDGRILFKSDRSMETTGPNHPDAGRYELGGRAPGLSEAGWRQVLGLAAG